MALVKRANCERIVPDEKVNEFLALGYSLIDKDGTVLKKGKAQSKEDLLVAYKDSQAENAELHAEIVRLKNENDALHAEIETLKANNGGGTGEYEECKRCGGEAAEHQVDKAIERRNGGEEHYRRCVTTKHEREDDHSRKYQGQAQINCVFVCKNGGGELCIHLIRRKLI